jgi:hypothetical protein
MNNFEHISKTGRNNSLTELVRQAKEGRSLDHQRDMINAIAAELNISVMDCAAAIVYLWEQNQAENPDGEKPKVSPAKEPLHQPVRHLVKFVRYRLNVGFKNNVTPEMLKKVLVEESGVDIKNITNIRIQENFTLIDLPDEMPQEIFLHLKTVEINHRQLDIRRIKPRKKKRGNKFGRHAGQKNALLS